MKELLSINNRVCPSCGKVHSFDIDSVISGSGALDRLPEALGRLGAKNPFILSDVNTFSAAGEKVCAILRKNDIDHSLYTFSDKALEPDEANVGLAVMHFDYSCDAILGVGSGVINDIGKILSKISGRPYIIVATAPSMDGYASASSSMTRAGLKISLSSRAPDIIIGDTDILCEAPLKMMKSGLGDMLAKYISICEWRIAALLIGEYYCEEIASLVRLALRRCVDNAAGLLKRDPVAVEAVFEGLVIGGIAMNYAGLSRPASGVEHYFSHVWDMRGVEYHTPVDFHGIQCAIGTLLAARIYEKIKKITPDRKKALDYAASFNFSAYSEELRAFLGRGAEDMIRLEAKDGKYDVERHAKRLDLIIENFDKILAIVNEEVPSSAEIEAILDLIDAPKSLSDIGLDDSILPISFKATKDIRDKYVLSRLAWDLGIIEELL